MFKYLSFISIENWKSMNWKEIKNTLEASSMKSWWIHKNCKEHEPNVQRYDTNLILNLSDKFWKKEKLKLNAVFTCWDLFSRFFL